MLTQDSADCPARAMPVFAAVIDLALLHGCGGGFAEDLADALVRGLLNCRPSAEGVNTNLTVLTEVPHSGAAVTVIVRLG